MKLLSLIMGLMMSSLAIADSEDCYITLIKDNCWLNYTVAVTVIDQDSKKTVSSITAEKGKAWAREKFKCTPGTTISYIATFSPVFWTADADKKYYSITYWHINPLLETAQVAQGVNLCFPRDFRNVPLPPDATAACRCEPSLVPPIKFERQSS
ncbi:MAG: hypothetical protein JJT82_00640 [Legionellaceae bacterium]|nr:hypothetical protein [Legionellaceae bacterium]